MPIEHERVQGRGVPATEAGGRVPGKPREAQGYLFLPRGLRRARFLVWLRRTHAWVGLWGAALALLFGATGLLLNHRAVLKIPALKVEQSVIQLPLSRPLPVDSQSLAQRLQQALALEKPAASVKVEPAQDVAWNGAALRQPPLWRVLFASPQRTLIAEYWEGNAYVTVKRQDPNVFAYLTRLHMGTGAGVAWVLLVDTLAGGLIALALSGTLLWSRLHGPRLLAAGLACTSLLLVLTLAWRSG